MFSQLCLAQAEVKRKDSRNRQTGLMYVIILFIRCIFLQLIHEPTNELNTITFMTYIDLLHVLAQEFHSQGPCNLNSYHISNFFLYTNECTSDCFKNDVKIYTKIAPTCFGAVTPSSGSSLSVLAKVILC